MSEARDDPRTPRGAVVTIIGAATIGLGSIMPWASAGYFSVIGVQGDGVITLVLAIIIAISAAVLWGPGAHRLLRAVVALLAAYALKIGIQDAANIADRGAVGIGIYLLIFGGMIVLVGVFLPPAEGASDRLEGAMMQRWERRRPR